MLLVQTKNERVLGAFLDRALCELNKEVNSECRVFVVAPEPAHYIHQVGKEITCSVNMFSGFTLAGSEVSILHINPSLQDADNNANSEFSAPLLTKKTQFQVYNLELFELTS